MLVLDRKMKFAVIHREILEYYSNMTNKIDIKCEKVISYFKTEQIENQINSNRDKIVAKLKEIEKIKLENLKQSDSFYDGLLCLFIPSKFSVFDSNKKSNQDSYETNSFMTSNLGQRDGVEFKFSHEIGCLVIVNFDLDKDIVEKLM